MRIQAYIDSWLMVSTNFNLVVVDYKIQNITAKRTVHSLRTYSVYELTHRCLIFSGEGEETHLYINKMVYY